MTSSFSIVFADAFIKRNKTFNWKHAKDNMTMFSQVFYQTLAKKETLPTQDEFIGIMQETMKQVYIKKTKKVDKPKRALSSFFLFCQEKREEVKAANPDSKVTEINKQLGAMWQELTEEEKNVYKELSEANKGIKQEEKEEKKPDSKGKKEIKKKAPAKPAAKPSIRLLTKEEDCAFTLKIINRYLQSFYDLAEEYEQTDEDIAFITKELQSMCKKKGYSKLQTLSFTQFWDVIETIPDSFLLQCNQFGLYEELPPTQHPYFSTNVSPIQYDICNMLHLELSEACKMNKEDVKVYYHHLTTLGYNGPTIDEMCA